MLELRDIITLKDNKYMVISKVKMDDKLYFYLVNTNKNDDLKFCFLEDDYLVEVTDKDLIVKLIPMFADQAMTELNNYMKMS